MNNENINDDWAKWKLWNQKSEYEIRNFSMQYSKELIEKKWKIKIQK